MFCQLAIKEVQSEENFTPQLSVLNMKYALSDGLSAWGLAVLMVSSPYVDCRWVRKGKKRGPITNFSRTFDGDYYPVHYYHYYPPPEPLLHPLCIDPQLPI